MSDIVNSSTADLVRRGQTGDKGAFGQLVERFQEEAYGLAYYHLGHREDALDVAQQAFLTAYLHLDSLTDPARFGGWLARIVTNECLRWHRRRRPALSLDTPALGDLQDRQAMSPERAVEHGELHRDLNRALMALPRPQRLALTLYYVAGLRYRKIAEVVELPITTVKGRIQEGRKRLRRILGPTYERRLISRQPATAKRQSRAAVKENVMAQLEELAIRYKVRDVYDLGDQLLIVVSDRISAFDVVLPTAIPGKGKVLNQLSAYWFEQTQDLLPNHVLTTDVDEYPAELQAHAAQLTGRSMLVRRAERVDIECVARGYITGSGWAEYQKSGTVCGIRLPAGLIEAQQLPEPIFTPTTKAETGHDEPLTFEEVEAMVGRPLAAQLRDATLAVYSAAAEQARERGIIIADTKMEFGIIKDNGSEGQLILIDELLTPDSSRFWDTETYEPGSNPPSYDKQYVRDYLSATGWNKAPPAPPLPPEVVARTQEKYADALRRLTGREVA